jgi:hypothetical protein
LVAAILFLSGALLLYTALVVPIQILVWDYSDPCQTFPTLYFDIGVDTFFLVSLVLSRQHCPSLNRIQDFIQCEWARRPIFHF